MNDEKKSGMLDGAEDMQPVAGEQLTEGERAFARRYGVSEREMQLFKYAYERELRLKIAIAITMAIPAIYFLIRWISSIR